MRIAIAGASGRIGGEVARLLAAGRAGEGSPDALRLVVRSAERAPSLPGAEVAVASFGDAVACRAAFSDVDALLLVSAGESADRLEQHRTAIGAARDAGVGRIVYTSFLGAAPDAEFTLARDHGATEEMIRDSQMAWTVLRDSFYADVLVDFAGDERVIQGPAGEGRCAFVARRDVAEVAAAVLGAGQMWEGAALELTGPEALSLAEAATRMTTALGRPFRYEDQTLEQARASRAAWDPEPWQMDAWISTYTAIGSGALDVVTGDVERVLGRAPLSLEDVLADPL